jgi:hypothetical protein
MIAAVWSGRRRCCKKSKKNESFPEDWIMKSARRIRAIVSLFMLLAPLSGLAQWSKKPYTEWSEKDALKVLNDSPWGQTQAFTDTSRQSSTTRGGSGSTTAISEAINVNFRVRLLSARPTRQAFVRAMELQQKGNISEQLASRFKAFANADFPDYIVVAVAAEADKPSSMLQQAASVLSKLTTGELKNETYLVSKDNRRVFLKEYQPPGKDGFGAKFIFPRLVDGEPFISANSGEMVFHSDLTGGTPEVAMSNAGRATATQTYAFTLNVRFKVKDMAFDGKLEY